MGRFGGRYDERAAGEGEADHSAAAKKARTLALFPYSYVPEDVELIVPAASEGTRDRCRFSFLRDGASGLLQLSFAEPGGAVGPIVGHALASRRINDLLPVVVDGANASPEALGRHLRAAHVHAPRWAGAEPVVSLVYEGDLGGDERMRAWVEAADELRRKAAVYPGETIHVVGRFKGATVLSGARDFVIETLALSDGRRLRYEMPEGSFSHPNGSANERSLDWLCGRLDVIAADLKRRPALLELYCGCGNHTVALAKNCDRTVAVEIDARLTAAATRNLAANGVDLRKATVLTDTVGKSRLVHRVLRNASWLEDKGEPSERLVHFDAVLVDPPRCGIDERTRSCLPRYGHILFVSCNPAALARDVAVFERTHDLAAMAVVDGFPGTPHVECLAHFVKRLNSTQPSSVVLAPAPKKPVRSLQDLALDALSDVAHELSTDAIDALDLPVAADLIRYIVSKQKLTTPIAMKFMKSRHTDIAAALGHLDLVAGCNTFGPGFVPSGGGRASDF